MSKKSRILIIDDNLSIHEDFKKILNPEKINPTLEKLEQALFEKQPEEKQQEVLYEIDCATQGEEGLELVKKAKEPYSVGFVDIRMPPGWDGVETIEKIWKVDPWIQMVICSAYSDYSWNEIIKRLGTTDNLIILKKPFEAVEVQQLASSLSKKWELNLQVKKEVDGLEKAVAHRTIELEDTVALVKATLESTADGIFVTNQQGKLLDFNRKFSEMWHIPRDALEKKSEETIIKYMEKQVSRPENFLQIVKLLHSSPQLEYFDEINLLDKRCFEWYTKPYTISDKTSGRVWSFRDITERKKLQEDLLFEATHDKLTNLPNRTLLFDRIRQDIALAKRNDQMVALLFCDLDRFKFVNDSLGHPSGDFLLKVVAKRLTHSIRKSDTVSRIGGDEFVIILTEFKMPEQIKPILDKILKVIQTPLQIEHNEISVTTSIGISLYPKDGNDPETLLKASDIAMYQVKRTGGNSYQFHDSKMENEMVNHLKLENDLRHALSNKEFFLVYQPIIYIPEKKITGFEALIRWQHPQRGILLPNSFISLAEESGLILSLGEWVLHTACLQHKEWLNQGYNPGIISVNVSGNQLNKPNFFQKIVSILEETKLEPQYLALEITESSIIESPEKATLVLNQLKEIGVSLVLDDFGTGYSSLSYLKKFPFDKLKIDRSFVKDLSKDNNSMELVNAIIAMANNLKLKVVAEGTETNEQLELLKKSSCHEMQGFFLGEPIPENECTLLLEKLNQLKANRERK